jgi:hypothetical protein
MPDKPGDKLFTFLNVAFVVVLGLVARNASGYELLPRVVTHTLGPCDLDWHSERPALVLACPGQDLIKVWPLPPASPWWEEEPPLPSGQLATLFLGCNYAIPNWIGYNR